jgi:hypothetical protein
MASNKFLGCFQRAFGCQAAASISDDEVRWTRFTRTMLDMVVVVFSAMVVLGSVADALQLQHQAWDVHRQTEARTELDRCCRPFSTRS